jgi:hypothetical protein
MPPDVKTTGNGQIRDTTAALEASVVHGNEVHTPASVFPVGSVYGNISGIDPAVELGYGTWYQIGAF